MRASKRQGVQPSLFQMVEMDALIPQKHILRQLDKVINWERIYDRTRALYSENKGRPAADPAIQLRLMILSYLFNHSERALYQLLPMHAGYLWFCGLDFEAILHPDEAQLRLPDRSTLVKTRKLWRQHGLFDDLMRDVVQQCIQVGLVKTEIHVAVDGTQVRANASIHSLAEIQLSPLESIDDYLARKEVEDEHEEPVENETDSQDPPLPPSGDGSLQEEAVHEDFHGKTFSNRTHRSTTDPDSRLYKKSKGQEAHPRFLVHNLIDVHSGVILDTRASLAVGTAEREVSMQQVNALRFRHPMLQIRTLSADKGYESANYLAELHQHGIIPLVSLKSLEPLDPPVYKTRALQPDRKAKRKRKLMLVSAYNYAKSIQRQGKYRSIQAKRVRIEHTYAEAKQVHGLHRARGWGLSGMEEQAMLTAIVQNLKRLCRFKVKRPGTTPVSCTQVPSFTACFSTFICQIVLRFGMRVNLS